jgi:hypothetical protein
MDARRCTRVVHAGRGVGTRLLRDDRYVDAAPPLLELLDGGRAERVGRREQHAQTRGLETRRDLRRRGGFARAVHADDEHDERPLRGVDLERLLHRAEQVANGCAQELRSRGVAPPPAFHLRDEPFGGIDADVAFQETRLELLDARLVERLAREGA